MSKVFKDFLAVDKEQELLQSFTRLGIQSDDEAYEDSTNHKKGARRRVSYALHSQGPRQSNFTATERRKSVKFSDVVDGVTSEKSMGHRINRIEAELRAARKKTEDQMAKKKKPKENFVDFYTDKDRAAAVSAGAFDIKQSLQLKQKQDRHETLLIPDEADISSVIALGLKEIKNANPENAIHFFSKVKLYF